MVKRSTVPKQIDRLINKLINLTKIIKFVKLIKQKKIKFLFWSLLQGYFLPPKNLNININIKQSLIEKNNITQDNKSAKTP